MDSNVVGLHLLDLPSELLHQIVDYLDTRSKVHLWETSAELRRSLDRRHLRCLSFAHRRVPRAICDFLQHYAGHIEELDLQCAQGFTEEALVSALTHMEHLRVVDVRHTLVTLRGAGSVCAARPGLSRLACDIADGVTQSHLALATLRLSFNNIHSVHFVVSSAEVVHPLQVIDLAANLKSLKITCKGLWNMYNGYSECFRLAVKQHPNLQFFVCDFMPLRPLSVRRVLDGVCNNNNSWKFAVACDDDDVYLSPDMYQFQPNYSTRFIEAPEGEELRSIFVNTMTVHAWCYNITQNKPNFNTDMLIDIDRKLDRTNCKMICINKPAPLKEYNLYTVCSCTHSKTNSESVDEFNGGLEQDMEHEFENLEESSQETYDLNLAVLGPANRKIQLQLLNRNSCDDSKMCHTISDSNVPWLRNITCLNMASIYIKTSLCNVIFEHSINLETLEVEEPVETLLRLTESIKRCKVLRNICLDFELDSSYGVNEELNLSDIFQWIAGCSSIENVYMGGDLQLLKLSVSEGALERFFVGCPHLCSLNLDSQSKIFDSNLREMTDIVLGRLNINKDSDFSLILSSNRSKWFPPSTVSERPVNIFDLNIMNDMKYF